MNASSNDYLVLTSTFTVFTTIWTFSSRSWGTGKRMVKNEKVQQRMKGTRFQVLGIGCWVLPAGARYWVLGIE